jgi:hypothetical protein
MAEQIGIVKQNMQAWDPELGTLVNKQVPILPPSARCEHSGPEKSIQHLAGRDAHRSAVKLATVMSS